MARGKSVKKPAPSSKRQTSSHDAYSKFSLKNRAAAIGFLQTHMPPELLAEMDLEKLTMASENLVHHLLGKKIADVLISVPYKNKPALIYVLNEHLRKPLHLLPFRMFLTILMVLQEWLRQHQAERGHDQSIQLPIVFPMVFYNGTSPYKGPLRLADQFEDAALFERILNGPITLIDTNTLVLQKEDANAFSYLFQRVMQSISSPNLGEILLELNPEMEKMLKEVEGYDFVEGLFRYVYGSSNMDPDEIRLIASQLEEGGKIVTALQQDTLRIRQELKKSKQIIKAARQEAQAAKQESQAAKQESQAAKQEAQAAKRKVLEAVQTAERSAREAELAERRLTIMVLNLLRGGMSIDAVAKCVELPVEAIQRLAQQFGQGKRD